jgi:hypothetical protein
VSRRSSLLAGAGVLVALAGGGAAVVTLRERPPAAAAVATPSLTTTTVRRTDLSDSRLFSGTLGFGTPRKLKGTGPGMITKLPPIGAEVTRGAPLYRVDDRPVVVLYGDTPLFRAIDRTDLTGDDVLQLRANLTALGYRTRSGKPATSDQSLLDALTRWQKKLGVAEPGKLLPGQVVVVAGHGRVSTLAAEPGTPADGPVLEITSTTRVVTVPMGPADAGSMKAVQR